MVMIIIKAWVIASDKYNSPNHDIYVIDVDGCQFNSTDAGLYYSNHVHTSPKDKEESYVKSPL